MREHVQIQAQPTVHGDTCCPDGRDTSRRVVWLQFITLAWMVIECGVALISAWKAHSPALLAFGSDSFVELLSATVVILQFAPSFTLSTTRAVRISAILLFVLAGVVGFTSAAALIGRVEPDPSWSGIAVTVAALVIMPLLSGAKRRAARTLQNSALAADAVQSATCAYLAAATLFGLAINAAFHIRWIDPLAALAAIPILYIEGKRALRGKACGCCRTSNIPGESST